MSGSRSGDLTPEQREELRRRLTGLAGRNRPDAGAAQAPEPAGTDPAQAGSPLSGTQYQLWLGEQLHGAASAYTLPIALRIRGPLDKARLQPCLDLLAQRHQALRARVAVEGGVPRQYFDRPARIPLQTRDLSLAEDGADGYERALAGALRAAADHIFTLDSPPYARAVLIRRHDLEHALILMVHHAFCDGVSLEVMITELLDAYAAPGQPALARDPGGQHADYASWEHSAGGRAQLARNAAYWHSVHRDLAELPGLPFAGGGHAPGQADPVAAFAVPARLRRPALELSRSAAATMHAVWLAGFAVTWHLASGAERLCLAVPAANRPQERFDGAVGAFVSAVPLILRTPPAATFTELVRHCAEALFDGAEHAALAGDAPPGDAPLGAAPALFTPAVLFSLTGEDAAPVTRGELTIGMIPVRVRGSQHALTVQLIERSDGVLYGQLTGQVAHYGSADLARLAAAYPRCLDALLTRPDVPLAAISLTSEEERADLARWSAPPARPEPSPPEPALPEPALPEPVLAYEAFRRWVRETPQAFAALDADGSEFSYRRLGERVAVFARALHAEGIGAGIPVAVCLPRSVDYLALTLAVWHLGGWTIPLNVADPPSRITALLAAAGARYIVRTGPDPAPGPASLDVLRLRCQGGAGRVPAVSGVQPADIAYGVFTSGTTGAPKCVAVGHGALANQLAWRRAAIGVAPGDRVLQTIPLAFDPSFWQCFGPLTAGAGVIMAAPAGESAQATLVDGALSYGATIVDVVPSLLAGLDDEDVRRLPARVVFCGGEPLPASQAGRYRRLGSGVLYNQYGPSETCIDAASHCPGADSAPGGIVPIGRPVSGARLYVLDPVLRQVPAGIPGELYVGGRGVAHGYVGLTAETAVRFLPDPFSRQPGSRMYRTGDRARWNPDGTVQFLGRDDDQVKIRGHRVELAEVDRALVTAPAVGSAAVVVAGQRFARLVAFLTGTGDLDVSRVRAHVTAMLPGYMVPAEFRVLDRLPLTANGKTDRRRLAGLADEREVPASAPDADPLLTAVLGTFAELTGLSRISPQDDLHMLGGTSLGAARVAAGLAARLGIEVPVRLVLRHSRAADLAAALASVTAAIGTTEPPVPSAPARPDDAAGTDVPGPQQRWLITLERHLGHPSPAIPVLIEPGPGQLAPSSVEAAVRRLAERHDALAPLPGRQGPPGTAVLAAWQPCEVAASSAGPDPANWPPEVTERLVPDHVPGIRAVMPRESGDVPQRILLLLARNRADGPSVVILARELRELLAGHSLPDPAPSYREHLRARALRVAADRTRLEHYWTQALAPVRLDPFSARRPAGRGFVHHGVRWRIPAVLDEQLSARAAALGVAPSALFLAALGQTVARATQCPRVAVGVPVGLRSGAEVDRLVGRAVDMVPVVLSADGGPGQAHRALLAALDHSDLPLERIARLVDPVDVAVRPPVCAVALFTYEYDPEAATATAAKAPDVASGHWSDVDLGLHLEPGPAGHRCLMLSGEQRTFGIPELRAMLDSLSGWLRRLCDPTNAEQEYAP